MGGQATASNHFYQHFVYQLLNGRHKQGWTIAIGAEADGTAFFNINGVTDLVTERLNPAMEPFGGALGPLRIKSIARAVSLADAPRELALDEFLNIVDRDPLFRPRWRRRRRRRRRLPLLRPRHPWPRPLRPARSTSPRPRSCVSRPSAYSCWSPSLSPSQTSHVLISPNNVDAMEVAWKVVEMVLTRCTSGIRKKGTALLRIPRADGAGVEVDKFVLGPASSPAEFVLEPASLCWGRADRAGVFPRPVFPRLPSRV